MSEHDDPNWTPMIYNKAMIANNLSILSKNKTMIKVALGGKDAILTALIDVNLKKGLIVFDTSPSEHLNDKLLKLSRTGAKFSTVFNGIQISFAGKSVEKARLSGHDVFVMPLPPSLYWLERRGAFRVGVPKSVNQSMVSIAIPPPDALKAKPAYKARYEFVLSKIRRELEQKIEQEQQEEREKFEKEVAAMPPAEQKSALAERAKYEENLIENPILPDENLLNVINLTLFDISVTGCSVVNFDEDFSYFLNVRSLYENCAITMTTPENPKYGKAKIPLEIMMKRRLESDNEDDDDDDKKIQNVSFEELIGFKFIEPTQTEESKVFLYIQALDRLHKKR